MEQKEGAMKRPSKSSKAFPAGGFVVLLILGFAGQAFGQKKPKFAYVANSYSNNVSAFTIDGTTGALSQVPGSPFAAERFPQSVAVDPSGQFAYVSNQCASLVSCSSSSVSAYTINGTTGALSPVPGSPFAAGTNPLSVAVDPSGQFAYVVNQCGDVLCSVGSVSAYTIDGTTGALSPAPGSPFAAGMVPFSVAVDPSGKFAYVANECGDVLCSVGNVSAYTINGTTGALSPVPGSPFAAGRAPFSVAVDPSGKFAYVANECGDVLCSVGNVSAYTINGTTGALSPVTGSPFAAGRFPRSVAVDPSGKFAYVANECGDAFCSVSGNVSAFTIDGTTGALSPVTGSPFAAGRFPVSAAVDPSGKFAYVANQCGVTCTVDGNVSAYTIDSTTGALSPVTGSPFSAGVSLRSVAIAGQASVPFAAFTLKGAIHLDQKPSFELEGRFKLGARSNGINPLAEDVTLQVGTFSTTIPAGSFRVGWRGFEFEGFINGVKLEVVIHHVQGNRFLFTAKGEGANLTGTVNPVTVRLTVGDDEGSTMVNLARF
jgi:6-phosphogluconolactonase